MKARLSEVSGGVECGIVSVTLRTGGCVLCYEVPGGCYDVPGGCVCVMTCLHGVAGQVVLVNRTPEVLNEGALTSGARAALHESSCVMSTSFFLSAAPSLDSVP